MVGGVKQMSHQAWTTVCSNSTSRLFQTECITIMEQKKTKKTGALQKNFFGRARRSRDGLMEESCTYGRCRCCRTGPPPSLPPPSQPPRRACCHVTVPYDHVMGDARPVRGVSVYWFLCPHLPALTVLPNENLKFQNNAWVYRTWCQHSSFWNSCFKWNPTDEFEPFQILCDAISPQETFSLRSMWWQRNQTHF